jgi:hypothetical protein
MESSNLYFTESLIQTMIALTRIKCSLNEVTYLKLQNLRNGTFLVLALHTARTLFGTGL